MADFWQNHGRAFGRIAVIMILSERMIKVRKSKFIWYLKQLMPLTYISVYTSNRQKQISTWKMWFGKVYKHSNYVIFE